MSIHLNYPEYVAFGNALKQEKPEEKILDGVLWQNVRDCVQSLRVLQFKHDKLEAEYFMERAKLEVNFHNAYEEAHNHIYGTANDTGQENCLWLMALSNNQVLNAKITDKDKGALKYLKYIKWNRKDNHRGFGFSLDFCFYPNPFFRNTVLTKTYDLIDEDSPVLRKVIGTKIDWYTGQCLTPNQTDNWESFFNFFSPPQVSNVNEEELAKAIENHLEQDYEIGSTIRELIPRVISWFSYNRNQAPPASSDAPLPINSNIGMTDLESGVNLDEEDRAAMTLLNSYNSEHETLEKEFLMKREELKAKYEKLYETLYNQRCRIVNGDTGPPGCRNEVATNPESATCQCNSVNVGGEVGRVKGVPHFWRKVLSRNFVLDAQITAHDIKALGYLRDIKCSKIDDDNKGFKLDFYFEPNRFFKNSILTKIFYMVNDDVILKAIGTEITWFPDHCLTKNHKSFFNFFGQPQIQADSDAVRNKMKVDYEIGATIREMIIPYAVSWFTGEAWRNRIEYVDDNADADDDEWREDVV